MFLNNWSIDGHSEGDSWQYSLDFKDNVIKLGCYGGIHKFVMEDAEVSDAGITFIIDEGGCAECCGEEVWELILQVNRSTMSILYG